MQELLRGYIRNKAADVGRRVRVGLLGFGKTNRAILDTLLPLDCAEMTVRQQGLDPRYPAHSVRVISDEDAFLGIYEDVIIPSPSVRREKLILPESVAVITDYDLLFYSKPKGLFSVSGSDGKSTVTTLASLLLSPTFPDLFVGGNLGTPLILAKARAEAFLLELSSFTLRYSAPRCGRALITNITPNHLDWHASFDEYKEAKLSLIRQSDEPILNLSDTESRAAARNVKAFCLVSDSLTHEEITRSFSTEHTVTENDGWITLDTERVIPISLVKRRERHNLENLKLSIALSIGYASSERIREVAKTFDGLPERCELFTKDGVDYVSSSIDTSPMRTKTTLEGLRRRVRIILGGRTKGLPLDALKEPLEKYVTKISIYGEAREEFLSFIDSYPDLSKIPHEDFPTMREAIDYAKDGTGEGDTVLLSPAATSYGEFDNYVERGRFFKDYVMRNCRKI